MKWNEYRPAFRAVEASFKIRGTPRQIVETYRRSQPDPVDTDNPVASATSLTQLAIEADWTEHKRPYYNVWPSVIEAFTKIDLDSVDCKDVRLPIPFVMIRFPEGHELRGAKSVMLGEVPLKKHKRFLFTVIDTGEIEHHGSGQYPLHTCNCIELIPGQTIGQILRYGELHPYTPDELNHAMIQDVTKLVVTLTLLNDNPELIERAPLTADLEKWDKTHDQNLIQRAERKGKIGWDIGRHIEAAPGFRSPHFAIRWMGRKMAEKKPVVRPIKGCLVRRKAILEMPSGYLEEEGN